MLISDFFITSSNGETLIHKTYYGSNKDASKVFWNHVNTFSCGNVSPCRKIEDYFYFHIYRNGLYFVIVSSDNDDALLTNEILSRLYLLLKDFCGVVNITSITANKFLVYELLDEFIDYGLVQLTETSNLKAYIQSQPIPISTSEDIDSFVPNLFGIENLSLKGDAFDKSVISSNMDSKREEMFADVIEHITAVIDKNGKIVQTSICGKVKMKCFLNVPCPVRIAFVDNLLYTKTSKYLGFGDDPRIDLCSFNPSVQIDQFEDKKMLLITPPEGEFDVMTYQLNGNIPKGLPFRFTCNVEEYPDQKYIELDLALDCVFPSHIEAVNLRISCPLPNYVKSIKQRANGNSHDIVFDKESSTFTWKINKICGTSNVYSILQLNYEDNEENKFTLGPVKLDFEISGYVTSSIQIKYIKKINSKNVIDPACWIRYISVADSYCITV